MARMEGSELPNVCINRFNVYLSGNQARIAFGEAVTDNGHITWHYAFVMTTDNATALAETIELAKKLAREVPNGPARKPN